MVRKKISTVKDLLDILKNIEHPETIPVMMSDDLQFNYDEENGVLYIEDEPQGNIEYRLEPPFDIFNVVHCYPTQSGDAIINMFDVNDDDMIMVFVDPAVVPDGGPFQIRLGRLVDEDGEWQTLLSLVYRDTVIGYGLHINAEVSEKALSAALEETLTNTEDGTPVARVLGVYQDYFRAVCDLYVRSYVPFDDNMDALWANMDLRDGSPLYVTTSKTPLIDSERNRVTADGYGGDFGVCILWSGSTPIVKYGNDTTSLDELEQHAVADVDYRYQVSSDITAAVRKMIWDLEDLICAK